MLCWVTTFPLPISCFIWRCASQRYFPGKMEEVPRQRLLAPLCGHPPAYKWAVSSLHYFMLPLGVTPHCTHDPFPCSIQSLANSSFFFLYHLYPCCTGLPPRVCTCTNSSHLEKYGLWSLPQLLISLFSPYPFAHKFIRKTEATGSLLISLLPFFLESTPSSRQIIKALILLLHTMDITWLSGRFPVPTDGICSWHLIQLIPSLSLTGCI